MAPGRSAIRADCPGTGGNQVNEWQRREFSNPEWVGLLRENARQLRELSRKVPEPTASAVLFMQAEICDRSADRMESCSVSRN